MRWDGPDLQENRLRAVWSRVRNRCSGGTTLIKLRSFSDQFLLAARNFFFFLFEKVILDGSDNRISAEVVVRSPPSRLKKKCLNRTCLISPPVREIYGRNRAPQIQVSTTVSESIMCIGLWGLIPLISDAHLVASPSVDRAQKIIRNQSKPYIPPLPFLLLWKIGLIQCFTNKSYTSFLRFLHPFPGLSSSITCTSELSSSFPEP